MVVERVDCPYSIRFHPHGNVGKLSLFSEVVLTVPRAVEASSATTSLSFVRFAVASILSSALSGKELKKHMHSGAAQSHQAYPRLLWVFIVTNAVAALVQLYGSISIVIITLASKDNNVW